MNRTLCRALLGTCSAALLVAGARAQQANSPTAGQFAPGATETVVVSGSRISSAGYVAPTPVTVLDATTLATEAKPDIGDAIRDLPAVQGGSPQAGFSSAGTAPALSGQSNVSLRGLGLLRTLVLVDGQRVVQANITGGVDLNLIPSTLVKRVDIVTGGASAAWGSDAVAGVVNLILDKSFTGFRANLEGSDNSQDTYRTAKLEGTYGADFLGGRDHFILSASYQYAPDTVFTSQAKWYNKVQLVPNPAYNAVTNSNVPQLIHMGNIGQSNGTPGGLILSNPQGSTAGSANLLRGINFIGPNAQPTPINIGFTAGVAAYGGDLGYFDSETPVIAVATPLRQSTAFLYDSYRLSDSIKASVQLNYGDTWNRGVSITAQASLPILSGNPYIPASVQSAMTANGIPSFTLGTLNTNNVDIRNVSVGAAAQSLGIPVFEFRRQQMRGVFMLEGSLGQDWTWNAYAQHGETKVSARVQSNSLKARITQAANAVVVTAANQGSSGLPIGSIACASTLSAPTNGCKPLNVFGTDVASSEAINWIDSVDNPDSEDITLNEDDFAASLQGVLPWHLAAGPIALATGAEFRHETGHTNTDQRGASAQWAGGNFTNFHGGYEVEEGFLELDMPILKDEFVESLDLNTAGRITNYSTNGLVESWKIGTTSQIDENIRFRAVYSVDIRAPSLSEAFTTTTVNNPFELDLNSPSCSSTTLNKYGFPNSTNGCASVAISRIGSGNPSLQPEVGHTVTAGFVLTPTFIPGAQFSVDFYNINIDKAIVTLGGNPTNCAQGQAAQFCNLLIFGGAPYSNGKPQLTSELNLPVNAANERVSGVDFGGDYNFDFLAGNVALDLKTTYIDEHTIVNVGVTCDQIGQVGSQLAGCGSTPFMSDGIPKFKGTLAGTYSEGPFSVTLQSRFQGSMRLNPNWTSGIQVDHNYVAPLFYLDLRASYQWTPAIQLYGAIDNVQDIPPQQFANVASIGSSYLWTPYTGDNLGRVVRVGIRVDD